MTRTRGPIARQYSSRRGTVYVLILGMSLILSVLALSAVATLRIDTRIMIGTQAALQAEVEVESAAQFYVEQMLTDASWRTRLLDGEWAAETLGPGSRWSYMLEDETDGDVQIGDTDPVRMHVRAVVGDVTRYGSLSLDVSREPVGENVIVNPDIESGIASWDGYDCDIAADTSDFHSGTRSLAVSGRVDNEAGPRQQITAVIVQGQPHDIELWIRLSNGLALVTVIMEYTTDHGTPQSNQISDWAMGTGWTKIDGQITPSWTGTLTSAQLRVKTMSTQSFWIDDVVVLQNVAAPPVTLLRPRPGSWRAEAAP